MPAAHVQTAPNPMHPVRRDNVRGFTLVEVMIAVVLVSILAAIALPSYHYAFLKARRVDAKNALLDLAAREERYFAIHNTYASNGTLLGYRTDFPVDVNTSGTVYYQLQAQTANATGYTISAGPVGDQVTDMCGNFVLTSLGVQSNAAATGTVDFNATNCW